MANPEHVALVRQGGKTIAEWRLAHRGEHLDLNGADLSGADLDGADLSYAGLHRADLSRADLHRADLSHADLSGAILWGASLYRANLSEAFLNGSNLSGAMLLWANLSGAHLTGADLSQAVLVGTALGHVDLSQVSGLATVDQRSPSSIGVDTLIESFRGAGNKLTPELHTFFRGAGVPEELLKEVPRIVVTVKYYSCFISYGQPDLKFATKLDKDLRARGVSCWTYEMDRKVGKRTWKEIGESRRGAERFVVLCSAAALVRDGLLKEIEEQIDEDTDKVVPISLDDLWKERGFRVQRVDRDLKPFLMERNYADFAGWDSEPARYDKALAELLKGLRRP